MPELRQITLCGTNIVTTPLGFGCNNLLGDKTQAQGIRLLEAAYDAGIRHFDVARYYGFGEAETVLGSFAQGRRDKITITTKFGMQPPGKLVQNKGLIQVVRSAMRSSPLLRQIARRGAKKIVQRRRFDVANAQASLTKSLKELQTDYIDLYLLHECQLADCGPELYEFLHDAKAAGKIREFGIGTAVEHTKEIYKNAPGFTAVLQFKHTILDPRIDQVLGKSPELTDKPHVIITHGTVSDLPGLLERLRTDQKFSQVFTDCFNIDGKVGTDLAGLLLQQALYANPGGIVLFRSANVERIAANVRAVTDLKFSASSFDQFASLIQ